MTQPSVQYQTNRQPYKEGVEPQQLNSQPLNYKLVRDKMK